MLDFHTHTLLSDGALLPAEHIQRATGHGYLAVGITDHVDSGTLEPVLRKLLKVCADVSPYVAVQPIPGVEITHVPPEILPDLAERARQLGAQLVVAHGETVVEPVPAGTNQAALACDVDLLAHPGLITKEDVEAAIERDIFLEITARRGHSLSNGHLVRMTRDLGAMHLLVINSDAHSHTDFLTPELERIVGLGAGLSEQEFGSVLTNKARLLERIGE